MTINFGRSWSYAGRPRAAPREALAARGRPRRRIAAGWWASARRAPGASCDAQPRSVDRRGDRTLGSPRERPRSSTSPAARRSVRGSGRWFHRARRSSWLMPLCGHTTHTQYKITDLHSRSMSAGTPPKDVHDSTHDIPADWLAEFEAIQGKRDRGRPCGSNGAPSMTTVGGAGSVPTLVEKGSGVTSCWPKQSREPRRRLRRGES